MVTILLTAMVPIWLHVRMMTLDDYLTSHNLSDAAFAARIGVASRCTVNRYRRLKRMPKPEILAAIKEATGGLVTADSFVQGREHKHEQS